jgi:hypothetical protein
MMLSAFSLSSFAGGIAGVASGLPFSFLGGFSSHRFACMRRDN